MAEHLPDIYPLTALQIGDMQSYISRAFLYLAPLSKKVFILVDNQPWITTKQPRSARLWQFMVTKYRMSPFVNSCSSKIAAASASGRWFALHGILVFEVSWRDVHGIDYHNGLLTDTSLALEARYMRKWEFLSADQAAGCVPRWFAGCASEAVALRGYLRDLGGRRREPLRAVSESEDGGSSGDERPHHQYGGSPPTLRRRRSRRRSGTRTSPLPPREQYSDALLLFRFRDASLPLRLRQIVMADIRLLTLLESGLPAWVVFLQSYPVVSHLYRPWMRPLARTLYLLASLATVLIGFYDLYKNVPLLKSAAARICGPLFGWVEEWDMVMRIQYLGTILFLRNLRPCLQGPLVLARAAAALLRPLAAPLLWDLAEILWSPFDLLLDAATALVRLLWPVLQVVLLPVRCAAAVAGCAGSVLSTSYNFGKDIWETMSAIFQLNHMSDAHRDMALLRTLWTDLFSQIFRAIRSILNGILVFFASCNRHRLSIHNHMQSRLRHMLHVARLQPYPCECKTIPRSGKNDEEDAVECAVCK